MTTQNPKAQLQQFGRFLTNMVLPNISAFIAWGFIAALFIPTGWYPNPQLASLVEPMSSYLLPLLVGFTGGRLIAGERGSVVGAVATMGLIVGSELPMFFGAMIAGPLGGYAIKWVDSLYQGKVNPGFEMLVDNFSAGLMGMILALFAFTVIGPIVEATTLLLSSGIDVLLHFDLLPLTSLLVEPAKVMFLNNAVNHGIFSPLGVHDSLENGKSLFFLIEANPGPGLGVLLAYFVFGRGRAKRSAPGAIIIHLLGGIQEIYFPYVLMNPKLLIAVIFGGASGVATLSLFDAGLVSTASPGSIFAIFAMTPRDSFLGVLLAVLISCGVSFIIASFFVHRNTVVERRIRSQQQ